MKLFKRLLVAPAALGLLAPLAANASEVNFNDVSNYSEEFEINSSTFDYVSSAKKLIAGGEGLVENHSHDGGFSETTTLDGKVIFTVGALNVEETGETEGTLATYMWQGNLNTSFTGDDNLYVRLKTGNATGWQTSYTYGTYLSSSKGNADAIKVDKIWYTFPVGEKHTVWIGPKIENYYMHATTPSIYQPITKQFTLGGNGAAYGASTNPGFGWAYKADNGFAISSNVVSKEGDSTSGWGTNESATSWATQIGYTQPTYSASVILNMKYNGWTDSYYTTPFGKLRPNGGNSSNIGLRGWWRPEDAGKATPSISLGYDTSETDATTNSNTTAYFVGLTWEDTFTPDDKIGVAFGQPQTREDETTVDPIAWEAYYSYQVNDSVNVTPAIFGGSDRAGSAGRQGRDHLGAVVETTFKF